MNEFLASLGKVMENYPYLGIPVAFLGGFLASLSPCGLAAVPLLSGYMARQEALEKKERRSYLLLFLLGLTISFVIIGLITASLSMILAAYLKYIYLALGLIMVLSGLSLFGVFQKENNAQSCEIPKVPSKGRGKIGSFFLGFLAAFISSPCSTPVLIGILSLVALSQNILPGVFMLIAYALGIGILPVLAAGSVGKIQDLLSHPKYYERSLIIKKVLGLIVILFGIYLFYMGA